MGIINRNSAALITIDGDTFNSSFTRFDARAVSPEIDITTFASEVNGEFDRGATRYIITFAGITRTDGPLSTLLENPTDLASTWQFDTGASIAGDFNYNDVTASRIAGTTSVFAGTATSTGSVTLDWPGS